MRRILFPALAAAATLALVGCDSAPTPTAVPTRTPTVATASTPTPTATRAVPPAPTPTPTLTPQTRAGRQTAPTGSPTPLPPFPWMSFGPGTWRVGEQIVPGVYEAASVSGQCEWARLSRFDDSGADVLFAETTSVAALVAVLPTDAGFRATEGCGRWTLRLSPTPTPTPRLSCPSLPSPRQSAPTGRMSALCALTARLFVGGETLRAKRRRREANGSPPSAAVFSTLALCALMVRPFVGDGTPKERRRRR